MPLIQKKGALFAIHHDSPPSTSAPRPNPSRPSAPPSLKLGGLGGKNVSGASVARSGSGGLGGTKGGLGGTKGGVESGSGEGRSVFGKKTNTSSSAGRTFIPFTDPASASTSLKPLPYPPHQADPHPPKPVSTKHLKPKSTTSTSTSNGIFSIPKALKSPLKSPLRSKTSSASLVAGKSGLKGRGKSQSGLGVEEDEDDIFTKPTLRKPKSQSQSNNKHLPTPLPLTDPFLAPPPPTQTTTSTPSSTPYLPSPLIPQTPILGAGEQPMQSGVFEGLGMITAQEENRGMEFTFPFQPFPDHPSSKFTYGLDVPLAAQRGSSKSVSTKNTVPLFARPTAARQKENIPPAGESASTSSAAVSGHRTLGSAFNLSGFLAGEEGVGSASQAVTPAEAPNRDAGSSTAFHGLGFGFTPVKAKAGPTSGHARGLSSMSGIDHFLPPSRSFGSDLADMNEHEHEHEREREAQPEWSPYNKARVTPLKSRHRERARQSGHGYNRSHGGGSGHMRAVSSISTNHFLPAGGNGNGNSSLNAVGEDEADSPMARARVTPLKSRNKQRHVRQKSSLSRGWGNGFGAGFNTAGGGVGLGIGGMTGLGFAVDLQEQRGRNNEEPEWADVDFDAASVHTSGGSRSHTSGSLTDSNKKSNSSLSGSVSNSSLGSASKRFSTLDMVDERKFGSPGGGVGGSPIGRRRSASPGERGSAMIARKLYEDEVLPASVSRRLDRSLFPFILLIFDPRIEPWLDTNTRRRVQGAFPARTEAKAEGDVEHDGRYLASLKSDVIASVMNLRIIPLTACPIVYPCRFVDCTCRSEPKWICI